jgi:hypothetical protein
MISRWRKPFAWYLAMALLVGATGYVGLQSEVLEEVYAASVGEAKADAPMMSPIFAEKLEHSIVGFDNAGLLYTGVPAMEPTPTPLVQASGGGGSLCWFSACQYSICFGSACGSSACGASACGSSLCLGSACATSACVGSSCPTRLCE